MRPYRAVQTDQEVPEQVTQGIAVMPAQGGGDKIIIDPGKQRQRRAEGPAFAADMGSLATSPFDERDLVVPMVVGYGTETSAEHVEGARRLAAAVGDGHLHPVEGAGHFANQSHPRAFAGFMVATLARAGLPAAPAGPSENLLTRRG